MSQQRFAVLTVLCGTLVLNGWVAAGLAGLGSPGIENGGAPIEVYTPRATAIAKDGVDGVSVPDTEIIDAVLPDPPRCCRPLRSRRRARLIQCKTMSRRQRRLVDSRRDREHRRRFA